MAGRSGPGAELISREESRRRGLLLGIGALILLSVGPVFGHHFATGLDHALGGRDHWGAVCLIALHQLLAPVHVGFHLLVAAGLLFAGYDRTRSWRASRRLLALLDTRPPAPGDAFWSAAHAARLDPRRIAVVERLPNPAFTAGWLRPRVYIARSLADRLAPEQLTAVLAHEAAHVRRRDPLRLSLLRFLALALFWIPALRRLADDVADEAEIQADDEAAQERPLTLASAMLELAGWERAGTTGRVGVGFARRADLLDRRIRRLAGEQPVARSHLTRRSLAAAALALVAVLLSGAIMAHPLPAAASTARGGHCEHPAVLSVRHLFCAWGAAALSTAGVCPHAG